MLKDIVERQKREKERLLSLPYVERDHFAQARAWVDDDIIKIIVGPRRAGKSVFALMLLKDRPFAYFNFDDESFRVTAPGDLDRLMQELNVAYGATTYVLFDEIHNVPRWELFVNRLHRQGYRIVLTGSNARLLSSDLATALTGRHIPIEILPFNFKEVMRARAITSDADHAVLFSLLHEYMVYGGYPEVVLHHLDARLYLSVLFDSLIFKDVVKHHKVRFAQQIDHLGLYLINNCATLYSLRKLARSLEFSSGITLEKYVGYLIEAYLLVSVNRYGHKAMERIKSPKKIYAIDNGFVAAKAVQHAPDNGRLLENMVCTELIKRGYQPNRELFYYKTRNDREIDFVLKKSIAIQELVQVAYNIHDQTAQEREVKALIEAAQETQVSQLTLLTWDTQQEIRRDQQVVSSVPILDWLMR